MKHFHLAIIVLLLIQLLPTTTLRSVTRAENTAPTPTSGRAEELILTPTATDPPSTQTLFVATDADPTETTPLMQLTPVSYTHTATMAPTATVVDMTKTPLPADVSSVQTQATSNELSPVIFVPGIMGSYLDYINPNDNNKVCNIWPTTHQDVISIRRCKGVNWQEGHRDLLLQLTNTNIYATDAIRNQFHIAWKGDVYKKLLNKLNETWPEYRADEHLFAMTPLNRCKAIDLKVFSGAVTREQTLLYTFGYDWRKEITTNAFQLAEFIKCVRQTHNNKKVSLVGHSMGGLVIKQLLVNDVDNSNSVANISTFNTPYLGSVRALQIMGTGEYDNVSKYILEAPFLKEVARKIPGAIQLLPSHLYLKKFPCRLVVNTNIACTDTEYWDGVTTEFGAQTISYPLADDVVRDDEGTIVDRTKYINYLIQFSSNKPNKDKRTTIARVTRSGSNWFYEYGAGDGTVNEFSLTRRFADSDYNPQTTNNRKVYTFGYCNKSIDHTSLVMDDMALTRLVLFLKSPLDSNLAKITQNTCINGDSVSLSQLNTVSTILSTPNDEFVSTNGLWPTLTWMDGVRLIKKGYRIQVSTNRDMSDLVVDECTSAKSYKPTSDLWAQSKMGTFYWRVNFMAYSWTATNPSSCTLYEPLSGWSVTRSFTNPVIDKRPQLTNPTDGNTTIDGHGVSLSWSPGTNVVATRGYRIQVSTDNSFQDVTKMVVNECKTYTSLYITPNLLPLAGTYYWRVNYATKAWDSRNPKSCIKDAVDNSLWSNVRSFSNTQPNPFKCDSGVGTQWDVCGNLIPYSILEARIEGLTWSGKPQYVYVWNKNKPLRVKVAGMFLTFSACNETTSACYSVYEQQIKSLVLPQGTYTFCFQSDYYGQCGINQYYFSIVSLGFYGSDLIRYNGLRVVVK